MAFLGRSNAFVATYVGVGPVALSGELERWMDNTDIDVLDYTITMMGLSMHRTEVQKFLLTIVYAPIVT